MDAKPSITNTCNNTQDAEKRLPKWLTIGAAAAISAAAAGLAVAWFYRGTLRRLRNSDYGTDNSNFGMESDSPHEDF